MRTSQVSERLLKDIDVATDNSVVRPAASTGSSGVRPLPLVVGFQRGTGTIKNLFSLEVKAPPQKGSVDPQPLMATGLRQTQPPTQRSIAWRQTHPKLPGGPASAPLTTATIVAFVPK